MEAWNISVKFYSLILSPNKMWSIIIIIILQSRSFIIKKNYHAFG